MSYNSRLFLAEAERRLNNPDHIIMRGTYKRHKPVEKKVIVAVPPEYYYTGAELVSWQIEDERKQDEYLKSKGIN